MKEEAEEGGAGEGSAKEDDGAVDTLLTGVAAFSSGLPFLSKKESAAFATSAEDILSTSFPKISLIRGGIVLRRCSLRMWSISTSFVSSLS